MFGTYIFLRRLKVVSLLVFVGMIAMYFYSNEMNDKYLIYVVLFANLHMIFELYFYFVVQKKQLRIIDKAKKSLLEESKDKFQEDRINDNYDQLTSYIKDIYSNNLFVSKEDFRELIYLTREVCLLSDKTMIFSYSYNSFLRIGSRYMFYPTYWLRKNPIKGQLLGLKLMISELEKQLASSDMNLSEKRSKMSKLYDSKQEKHSGLLIKYINKEAYTEISKLEIERNKKFNNESEELQKIKKSFSHLHLTHW